MRAHNLGFLLDSTLGRCPPSSGQSERLAGCGDRGGKEEADTGRSREGVIRTSGCGSLSRGLEDRWVEIGRRTGASNKPPLCSESVQRRFWKDKTEGLSMLPGRGQAAATGLNWGHGARNMPAKLVQAHTCKLQGCFQGKRNGTPHSFGKAGRK